MQHIHTISFGSRLESGINLPLADCPKIDTDRQERCTFQLPFAGLKRRFVSNQQMGYCKKEYAWNMLYKPFP